MYVISVKIRGRQTNLIAPAKRIMSLKEPRLKMSKSHKDPKSRILITDTEEEIKAKISGALTDMEEGISYDTRRRPGVSNLLEILKHTTEDPRSCEEIAKDQNGRTMQELKDRVTEGVVKSLAGVRESFLDLMRPSNETIYNAMRLAKGRSINRAGSTMRSVRERLGILEFHKEPNVDNSKRKEK